MSSTPEEMQLRQSPSMQAPKRWPLVTQPENRSTSFLKDSRLVNCYAEKHSEGYQVEKRFGLGPIAWSLSAGIGQGLFNWEITASTQLTAMAANNNFYILSLLLGIPRLTNLGTIITSSGFGAGVGTLKFCIVEGSNPYLVFGSGNGAPTYWIQASTGLNIITDVNFPGTGTVPGIVYLDGTTYVMDINSQIYGSANLNDPTVWSALNKIVANSVSDLPIALARQLTYIIALKSTSVQIFYDAGNPPPGSPLSTVAGALINYGCISADTLQEIDGVLIWASSDRNNVSQIGMLKELQFTIISTPAIDRFLNLTKQTVAFSQSFLFRSFSFRYAGHRFYGITNVSANATMIYDLDQKLWYQWSDAGGNFFKPMAVSIDLANNLLVLDYSSGLVNLFAPDYTYPNDNGVLFPVDIYTPNYDAGVDRIKQLSQMRFNADQTAGSTLQVRFSDNDYASWNNFRSVDLSKERPILNDEGSFYRRAYHFRHQCNTALRIKSVDLQMDLGTL